MRFHFDSEDLEVTSMHHRRFLGATIPALLIAILIAVLVPPAEAAGKYKTLHSFNSTGPGGATPKAALIFDAGGNLYGTTSSGGTYGVGNVFKLVPNSNGGWTEQVLHQFAAGTDGANPVAGLTFDSAGNLYGTTFAGGSGTCANFGVAIGCGTVFKLSPKPAGGWTETILYRFTGSADGASPAAGLIFDAAGNLYGTTEWGGTSGFGTVFKLAPTAGAGWTESVLYSFTGGSDGLFPVASLIFDAAGNLYGTTLNGGGGCQGGTAFKLMPNADGSWTENILYEFCQAGSDAFGPAAPLILDSAGNLYGTTMGGGSQGSGTAFELAPNADGTWTQSVLCSFDGVPQAPLVFDSAGNLYGTEPYNGGDYSGAVFKIWRTRSGGWTCKLILSFGDNPGNAPYAGVIFDAAGNLYGTTFGDGTFNVPTTFGTVFEIMP
jgi:uncharacterized repeat protein (TIGR03803 family)